MLKDIQFKSKKSISIVDIKHDKGLKSAIKSGARMLSSESEFDFIVYLKSNMLESLLGLTEFLNNFKENKQDYKALPTRSNRNVLFDVFSINELLNRESIIK